MHKLILVSTLIAIALHTSCDTDRKLKIRAPKTKNSVIAIYGRKTMLTELPDDTQHIVIMVPNGNRDTIFHYPAGAWNDEAIMRLATNIDSVVLTGKSDKFYERVRMSGGADMMPWLKSKVSGGFQTTLTINSGG